MNKYGILITSYKDKNSKDQTPEAVVKTVKAEFKMDHVDPAWGVYKGQKEPSAQIIYETEKDFSAVEVLKIKQFIKKYDQESALFYKFDTGTPAIRIPVKENIDELQKEIMKFTNGKFGDFLTYIPEENYTFILCVKEFGMDCKEFHKQALLVANKFGGKLFKTANRVIKNE